MVLYTVPEDRRYTPSHLWVSREREAATIGLTERGQELHGPILYVGLPAVGAPLAFGMPLGYLQSAGFGLTQLFPPVQGAVAAINEELWAKPNLVNDDPLGDGWLVRVALSDAAEIEQLESAAAYLAALRGESGARTAELPPHLRESGQPAFLIDERRHILTCNPAAEAFIGLTRRQMRHGPLCSELFGCHHDDQSPMGKGECPGLCAMMNLEPITETEYLVTGASGRERRVQATYTPLALPGLPRRAVVVLTPLD